MPAFVAGAAKRVHGRMQSANIPMVDRRISLRVFMRVLVLAYAAVDGIVRSIFSGSLAWAVLPGRCCEPARHVFGGGCVLPVEFETELNAPGGISRGDCSECGVSQVRIGLEEIRMVQRVKHLEAELQSPRLA